MCTVLLGLQRKNIPLYNRFTTVEILRIVKLLPSDPTITIDDCCNVKQYYKYPSIFMNKTKRNLLRLFYLNFMGPLTNDHRIYHTCSSTHCFNVNHIYKKRYTNKLHQYYNKPINPINRKTGYKKNIIVSFD